MVELNKEKIFELYNIEGFSAKDISKKFNCSDQTIYNFMEKRNMPRRNISDSMYCMWMIRKKNKKII